MDERRKRLIFKDWYWISGNHYVESWNFMDICALGLLLKVSELVFRSCFSCCLWSPTEFLWCQEMFFILEWKSPVLNLVLTKRACYKCRELIFVFLRSLCWKWNKQQKNPTPLCLWERRSNDAFLVSKLPFSSLLWRKGPESEYVGMHDR